MVLFRSFLSLIFLAAAAPATAQDLVFSITPVLTCMAGSEEDAERQSCIGLAAEACIAATPGGGSTLGMGSCISRELDYWDDLLNARYQALREREAREDAEMASSGFSLPNQADALRDMQRAWIGFRDATCGFEAAQWGGGTGAGPATVGCLMRETGAQVIYLDGMLRDY